MRARWDNVWPLIIARAQMALDVGWSSTYLGAEAHKHTHGVDTINIQTLVRALALLPTLSICPISPEPLKVIFATGPFIVRRDSHCNLRMSHSRCSNSWGFQVTPKATTEPITSKGGILGPSWSNWISLGRGQDFVIVLFDIIIEIISPKHILVSFFCGSIPRKGNLILVLRLEFPLFAFDLLYFFVLSRWSAAPAIVIFALSHSKKRPPWCQRERERGGSGSNGRKHQRHCDLL